MIRKIPIQNVFYLLCYAWGMADMRNKIKIGVEYCHSMDNLLVHILVNATNELLRRVLYQGYHGTEKVIDGIKGRLNIASTLKISRTHQGKTVCEFDELTSDVKINQIIYSSLSNSLRINGLSKENKERVIKLLRRFPFTHCIRITERDFHDIRLHRNNRYYQFILNVCEMLHNSMLPDESRKGIINFIDVLDDERKMNILFERFLLNFCRQECGDFFPEVGRTHIHFKLTPIGATFAQATSKAISLLPIMETDVTLYNPKTGKKTILDAKYYQETLVSKFGQNGKIRREHLSQIITYVMNQEDENKPHTKETDGILVYPTTNQDIDVAFSYKNTNHIIRICTINLNQDWQLIENRLKEIVCS